MPGPTPLQQPRIGAARCCPPPRDDAPELLRTPAFEEKVASTHDGRWYRVRIMPYRRQLNVITTPSMTFIDITEIRQLEAELRRRCAQRHRRGE